MGGFKERYIYIYITLLYLKNTWIKNNDVKEEDNLLTDSINSVFICLYVNNLVWFIRMFLSFVVGPQSFV